MGPCSWLSFSSTLSRAVSRWTFSSCYSPSLPCSLSLWTWSHYKPDWSPRSPAVDPTTACFPSETSLSSLRFTCYLEVNWRKATKSVLTWCSSPFTARKDLGVLLGKSRKGIIGSSCVRMLRGWRCIWLCISGLLRWRRCSVRIGWTKASLQGWMCFPSTICSSLSWRNTLRRMPLGIIWPCCTFPNCPESHESPIKSKRHTSKYASTSDRTNSSILIIPVKYSSTLPLNCYCLPAVYIWHFKWLLLYCLSCCSRLTGLEIPDWQAPYGNMYLSSLSRFMRMNPTCFLIS